MALAWKAGWVNSPQGFESPILRHLERRNQTSVCPAFVVAGHRNRRSSQVPVRKPHLTSAPMTNDELANRTRIMLNKVPEVTVYFWIIKILCTTVGESFADYINETLGFGLRNTTVLFGVAVVGALVVQFRLRRYVPAFYWLSVVLISVEGTLLTDNLTD